MGMKFTLKKTTEDTSVSGSSEIIDKIPAAKQQIWEELDRKIDKEDWLPARKKVYKEYAAEQLGMEKALPAVLKKRFSVWGKQKEFARYVESYCKSSLEKFRISGMVACMCATLVFYFAKAMVTGSYLVGFSVDALVGVIALVLLIHNIQIKYSLTRAFSSSRDYLYTDLLAVLLCTLLKMALPVNLDASLIVLIVAYFSEKKRFSQAVDALEHEVVPAAAKTTGV